MTHRAMFAQPCIAGLLDFPTPPPHNRTSNPATMLEPCIRGIDNRIQRLKSQIALGNLKTLASGKTIETKTFRHENIVQ